MRTQSLARRARVSEIPLCTVTDTTARIAFHADRACRVAVRYRSDGACVTTPEIELRAATNSVAPFSDYTGRIDIEGLAPDTAYAYWFVVDGREDRGTLHGFRTFPSDGAPVSFSFAFGSCNGRTRLTGNQGTEGSPDYADHYMRAQTFDAGARFVLYLGDWIYADDENNVFPTPSQVNYAEYRAVYRHSLRNQYGYPYTYGTMLMTRAGPVFTMLDDHEFVNDFSGKNKTDNRWLEAFTAWREYAGRANPDSVTEGEAYYAFRYGDVGFFVVDGRTFRSTVNATDDANKAYLGPVQLAALKNWLSENNEAYPIKVIATSTPVGGHGTTGNDSWGGADNNSQAPSGSNGYRTERNDLLDYITANGITGVVFVSGDNHNAVCLRFTYGGRDFYELSASPFNRNSGGAVTDAANLASGPVYFKYNGGRCHGIVSIDTTASPATVSFQLYNPNGSMGASFVKTFTADDLNAGL